VRVGVLAIQGDFAAHARALVRYGVRPSPVRLPADLEEIDALVLPGGESSAMLKGIGRGGLDAPLRAFLASGRPVLGTCAGAILLARNVTGPAQPSFAALDIDVERNAYGTQVDSFAIEAQVGDPASPFAGLRCVLIRAPRITRVGPGVIVHASVAGTAALVSSGSIWAATFHPELTGDARVITAAFGANQPLLRATALAAWQPASPGAQRPAMP
jgi:pyridoxal 5'-phosphate synthase pdxT subunit